MLCYAMVSNCFISFPNRTTRDKAEQKNLVFTSNNIIIVGKPFTRPSEGFLFVEFAVMKPINGKTYIINPVKVRQAIRKGSKDGIAGYKVILDKEHTSSNTSSSVGSKARLRTKPSDGFKIGFAVVLVVMLTTIVIVVAIHIARR